MLLTYLPSPTGYHFAQQMQIPGSVEDGLETVDAVLRLLAFFVTIDEEGSCRLFHATRAVKPQKRGGVHHEVRRLREDRENFCIRPITWELISY